MVRKVQKAKATSLKPNTTVKNAPNKAVKVETLTNGHGDSESDKTGNEIIDKSGVTSAESKVTSIKSEETSIKSEVTSIESEVTSTESNQKVESTSEGIVAENVDEDTAEKTESSDSENSKTTQKPLKRKTPAVSKETKEKRQAKANTEFPEDIDTANAEDDNPEETKSSVPESSKTVQKPLKRKTPTVSKEVKEKKQAKASKLLEEDNDAEEETPEETKPTVSESSKTTQKSLKRKAIAVSKAIEKKPSKAKTKAKRQKVLIEVPKIKSVSGKVFVIGENDVGQLGLGEDISEKRRPVLLDLPHSIVDIAAGGMHSVCLTESGEVITFGCNDEGALGRITAEEGSEFIPKKVDIPERIVQVSAGDSHSAALSDCGQVYIWGNFRNVNGPMGLIANGAKQTTPVKIMNGVTVVKIASGSDHLVCLSNEGVVYTCGCGEAGQLGRVSEHASVDGGRKGRIVLLTPDKVPVLKSNKLAIVSNIWTGSYATFLNIQDSGIIYAFGLNNFNQLGFETQTTILKPKQVDSFKNKSWSQIIGGQHHTLALDDNGLVYSLGRTEYGRLGLGEDCDIKSEPTKIPRLQDDKCIDISCGNVVSFAVTDNGSAFSWGMGTNHQLGHGDEDDKHTPHQIEGNFAKSWKAFKIAGGGQHTLILATPKESLEK